MNSIFKKYYTNKKFIDRFFEMGNKFGVDVIIPVLNTNELWEKNLLNFYKEIPICQLLVGDGGCTDETFAIVSKFPRVKIINQKKYNSLGYCLRELIENVKTEWFIYLHSDVFLPCGWFDAMVKNQSKYDWFECRQKITTMIEHELRNLNEVERAYSGSQMGRTGAFANVLKQIDDDYLYRNEDIILQELIEKEGFKYGKVQDTFHYHQVMNKRGDKEPKFNTISITKKEDIDWEKRMWTMQVKGIVKYLQPKPHLIKQVNAAICQLQLLDALDWAEFKFWVHTINPVWTKYIKRKSMLKRILYNYAYKYRSWLI